MSQSTQSWVVVGDASGARIFKFDKHEDPWTLVETLNGDGTSKDTGTRDFGPKASEHKGALHNHGDLKLNTSSRHGCILCPYSATTAVFNWPNPRSPSTPFSRPKPERFMPPNGISTPPDAP